MKKEYLEIQRDIKKIEEKVKNRDVNAEDEKKLDELIVRKKELEEKFEEMRAKAEEGTKSKVNFDTRTKGNEEIEDRFATREYRKAFRDLMLKGEKIPRELRADAITLTSDIGDVIPTTIVEQIVNELEDIGDIYSRITKTEFAAGVDIPVNNLKPIATWVAEGEVAETQKSSTGVVSFSSYKLQVRIATSLIAATVSLDAFERLVAENIAEAMIKAIEKSVINGSGIGQPLGLVNDTDIENVIDFAVEDATWTGWKTKLFSNIPLGYRKKRNGVILVSPGTWDKYMDGLMDENGNPVYRYGTDVNGNDVYRFNGKTVVLTDELPSLDEAEAEEAFLIYVDLADYTFNSNMQITYKKYFDESTDQYIDKSTLIGDGKLADKNGAVILQIAEAAVVG